MINIAISGACGKMGSRISAQAAQDNQLRLTVCLEHEGHPQIGKRQGEVIICDNCNEINKADVLIEFTNPQATIEHLEVALRYKIPMIIGTTGLTGEQINKIKSASTKIPIVFSPNMSIGVNLLFRLVKEAAEKLSNDYSVNIVEAHHIHKKDAPSGTAKRLAQIIKETSKREIKDIKSIREGEIIGDHEVIFESPLDKIRLSHSAKTRDIFARGALEAAKWVVGEKPGLYDMQDVLV